MIPGLFLHIGLELDLRQSVEQRQCQLPIDEYARRLYHEYKDRIPSEVYVPTLDGPRLRHFHVVSLPRLEEAWPGEALAARYEERIFVSDLLPPDWVRYAACHLHHRDSFQAG